MRRAVILLALCATGADAAACAAAQVRGAPQSGVVVLAPCEIDGVPGGVLCGTLAVQEDREREDARTIDLSIAVLNATGTAPEPDPVFVLTGGPGQSAIEGAARFAAQLAAIRERRALVLVDRRGTGGSNPLRCMPAPSGDPFTAEIVRACRRQLEDHADLRQYTMHHAVRDLEAVRDALGYQRINLDAGSYGTRVALVYMRQHPDRVRTAVLRGVSPGDMGNPLPFATAVQRALERLFADCAADRGCAAAFPQLPRSFRALLERLERAPETVRVQPESEDLPSVVVLTRELVAARVHLMLCSGELAARLPFLIHEAAGGNVVPLANLAVRSSAFLRSVASRLSACNTRPRVKPRSRRARRAWLCRCDAGGKGSGPLLCLRHATAERPPAHLPCPRPRSASVRMTKCALLRSAVRPAASRAAGDGGALFLLSPITRGMS